MKEIYLFDFDGTLVDSMPTFMLSVCRVLDENHIHYDEDLIKTITPLGFYNTAKYFKEQLGLNMDIQDIISLICNYLTHAYETTIPAKDNVIPVLRTLKARGADLNILTASPHTSLDPCLERLGINTLFTNIWSCDDFGTAKSDPNIYRMAAERMNADVRDVWFLDDNIHSISTGKKAGMMTCGVYDDSSSDTVDEMKRVCHRYIYNFTELL